MRDFFFQTWVGWTIMASPAFVGLAAIAYYFPPFRKAVAIVGTLGIAALVIYKKGQQDQKARTRAQSDKAAKELQHDYDEIAKRPIPPGDTVNRLQRGDF